MVEEQRLLFRQFEPQIPGLHRAAVEKPLQERFERRLVKGGRRDIDARLDPLPDDLPKPRRVPGRRGEDIFLQLVQDADILRQTDDQRRVDHPEGRVVPAQQRLRTDAPSPVVELGLVVERQLAVFHRFLQVGREHLRAKPGMSVEFHQIDRDAFFLAPLQEGDQALQVFSGVPELLPVVEPYERHVRENAKDEVEQLQQAPGDGARRDVAPKQDGRRPLHLMTGNGDQSPCDGRVRRQGHEQRGEHEREKQIPVEDDRQSENHEFVDVEEHGNCGDPGEGPAS